MGTSGRQSSSPATDIGQFGTNTVVGYGAFQCADNGHFKAKDYLKMPA